MDQVPSKLNLYHPDHTPMSYFRPQAYTTIHIRFFKLYEFVWITSNHDFLNLLAIILCFLKCFQEDSSLNSQNSLDYLESPKAFQLLDDGDKPVVKYHNDDDDDLMI